ncbi:MAG: beta-aspartyl-peptidase [Synergistaceae bacterium]|nr:beta-aspartyl-peptidase [Synergistaceae bacterium]
MNYTKSVTLIRHASLYAPEALGKQDILFVGNYIAKISSLIDPAPLLSVFPDMEVYEAEGCALVPGFIDTHVHFNGAGGENRPEFRTPPAKLSELTRSGITSAVGLLGTDGITRSLNDLYMKARGLQNEGISTWIFTGSYQIPSPTITGSVMTDIAVIDKVVGLKIAYADHRSSQPDHITLVKAVAESRVGGVVGGKSGKVMVHMGNSADGLERIRRIFARTEVPLTQIIPTHLNRSTDVFEAAIIHGKAGGNVEITSGVSEKAHFHGTVTPSKAIVRLIDSGVPIERITMSSDGYGSMTVQAPDGTYQASVSPVSSLYEEFADTLREGVPMTDALKIVTRNPADSLSLHGKGHIKEGMDADLLIIDEKDYNLKAVFAMGRKMVEGDIALVKGAFE